MKPAILLAKTPDARAITALRTAVAQHMTRQHGEGHWSALPSRAEVLRQMRASQVLLARLNEHVVGTVRLTSIHPRALQSAGFTSVASALYLLGLAVAPDCRRMGIGRALVEAAKDLARSRSVEALWLDAYAEPVGAGTFYLRCGFHRVDAAGASNMPLVYYEWLVS